MSLDYFEETLYRSQKSLTFDGLTDWMAVYNLFGTDTFIIGRYDPSSISLWVKSTKNSVIIDQTIMSRWFPHNSIAVNEGGWRIYLSNEAGVNRALVFNLCGYLLNGVWLYSDTSFPLNEWVHVVMTWDGSADISGLKMYWNGVQQTTILIFNNWFSSAINSGPYSHLMWGVQYTAFPNGVGPTWPPVVSHFFEGLMDETTLWRYELDATEVLQLYHCGRPKSPMNIGLPNGKPSQTHFRIGEAPDGTLFAGSVRICYGKYPIDGGYFRNAFWSINTPQRISEDVP